MAVKLIVLSFAEQMERKAERASQQKDMMPDHQMHCERRSITKTY